MRRLLLRHSILILLSLSTCLEDLTVIYNFGEKKNNDVIQKIHPTIGPKEKRRSLLGRGLRGRVAYVWLSCDSVLLVGLAT